METKSKSIAEQQIYDRCGEFNAVLCNKFFEEALTGHVEQSDQKQRKDRMLLS